MRVSQHLQSADGWIPPLPPACGAQLVLTCAPSTEGCDPARDAALRTAFPDAFHVFASGGGQIAGTELRDAGAVVTAVTFDGTVVRAASVDIAEGADSDAAGRALAALLPAEGLRHVLVLSDGTRVNGSALVRGLSGALPKGVTLTGGLAGDDDRFENTLVALGVGGPASPRTGLIAAIGLYGERVVVGVGSVGGWEPFGPDRRVTRSEGNVLHELDGESALALYRRYLGPFADGLPATGLLFPLSLRTAAGEAGDTGVARTVLGVDEAAGTITFAGDVPQGHYVRLMKASVDRLIDGATAAAGHAAERGAGDATLALLVSCVGRRWVLKQRTEEELDAVRAALGDAALAGFYSYGEIAPSRTTGRCELHNQTMTITTIAERAS